MSVDGQGGKGRIIGELEIDFVRVKYTKDTFEDLIGEIILTIRDKIPWKGQGELNKQLIIHISKAL